MRSLLARFERELTVLAAVLIATGGFAVAALLSEGSQAVGAGTYVVRSNTDGGLVTGEVLDVTTNERGKSVTVVRWRTREGQTVTRALPARPPSPIVRTITEPGTTVTVPTVEQAATQTVDEIETITDMQTVVSVETVTETVVVTETLPEPPGTTTGEDGGP